MGGITDIEFIRSKLKILQEMSIWQNHRFISFGLTLIKFAEKHVQLLKSNLVENGKIYICNTTKRFCINLRL